MKTLTIAQAIEGYKLAAASRRLSPHTIADYTVTFNKFLHHIDPSTPLDKITKAMVVDFLISQNGISNKTLLNYHTGLSALWTWMVNEAYVKEHLLSTIQRPKPEKKAIIPFTADEIKLLLSAIAASRPYQTKYKIAVTNTLPNPERNRAIIMILLDTGIRASEMCDLTIADNDVRNTRLHIDHGKGAKERYVPYGSRTASALWKYLALRNNPHPDEPLFTTTQNGPMDRHRLDKLLSSIGDRADVKDVHPHRFRHTFAVNYLRNNGDPWSLQLMLGHETMDMVKTYLRLSKADLAASHRRASPVDNMRL